MKTILNIKVKEIFQKLSDLGDENTKKIYLNHGAKEPFFGVRIGDLKKIQKTIKTDYELSLDLYDTDNSDAMYLAGLIADTKRMTKQDLQNWVNKANWYLISEYAVAGVAAENPKGLELAQDWIKSDNEMIASAGWATLSGIISLKPDNELDLQKIEEWLNFIKENIHRSKNRVRYTMNGFVISVGVYIAALTGKATEIAKAIGKVSVEMGDTSCKVPFAPEYIKKVISKNKVGKKRKTTRC